MLAFTFLNCTLREAAAPGTRWRDKVLSVSSSSLSVVIAATAGSASGYFVALLVKFKIRILMKSMKLSIFLSLSMFATAIGPRFTGGVVPFVVCFFLFVSFFFFVLF